jgi:predicted DNA-binding transcriptional regulator AlpA
VKIAETVEPWTFDTQGAAVYLGVSPQLLEKWRCYSPDQGPRFVRIGARAVRYRRQDLDAFLAARVVGGAP